MSVVTRFPPSPTGFMHIGNARTALFNWLYAKHHNGKFLLRIEDTDRARHSEEAVQVILNGLEWLGLSYDNQPVSQFANKDRHIEVVKELVQKGKAYPCYCTPEELDIMRKNAREEGRSAFYDRRWRDKAPELAPKHIQPVIRIKAPLDGQSNVEDAIQGSVRLENRNLDDFVILRSDGTPTYMLAVVVDDHDMGITHVMRGDDHLNNVFRQNIIYDAMGWKKPIYAHLPLIHGPDGAKFSKRHGAEGLEDYKAMGYLPEAMRNYLLRLGWGHGNDEIISNEQAIEWFDLDGIGKSAAKFDIEKLNSLNAHYIKEKEYRELAILTIPFVEEIIGKALDDLEIDRLEQAMGLLKARANTLVDIAKESELFFKQLPFTYDDGALKILNNEAHKAIDILIARLELLGTFDSSSIEQLCRDLAAESFDGKLGKVAMPLRAALTGTDKSPPIFAAAAILGRVEVSARLQAALNNQ